MSRMWTAAAIALAIGAAGCSSSTPPGTNDGGAGGEGGGGTGGQGPSFITPVSFVARGGFGYDPETQMTRGYYPDATSPVPLHPWLELIVTQETSDGTEGFDCIISFFNGNDAFPNTTWPGARFGLDLTGSDNQNSCYGWDPEIWYEPDEVIDSFGWGLGIGTLRAELDEGGAEAIRDTMPELTPRLWQEHWGPFLLGGSLYWDKLDGLFDWGYALGYEVDEGFVVQYDNPPMAPMGVKHLTGNDPRQIARDDIEAEAVLPRGVYVVQMTRSIDAEMLLKRP